VSEAEAEPICNRFSGLIRILGKKYREMEGEIEMELIFRKTPVTQSMHVRQVIYEFDCVNNIK
jgi:hypothetical protein